MTILFINLYNRRRGYGHGICRENQFANQKKYTLMKLFQM